MFINDLFNDKDKPLNEVSNELLGRYKKAAGADATAADKRGDVEQGNKRFRGIVKATVKQGDNDAKRHKQQGVAEVQPAPTTTQPALTPAQTKKAQAVIDASGPAATQITQAGEKWQAGNKFGAVVDTAKAVNNVANAAGATFGDKVAGVGSALKGGYHALKAHVTGKDPGTAFAGSVASDLTQPLADYTNSKDFVSDFNTGMSNGGNRANPYQKAYDNNLVNANSVNQYVTGANNIANKAKSGDANAMKDFASLTPYRDDQTPYLDINKRNVITQQPVQTKAEIQAANPVQEGDYELEEMRRLAYGKEELDEVGPQGYAGDDAAYNKYAGARATGDMLNKEMQPEKGVTSFTSPQAKAVATDLSTGLAGANPEMEKRYTMNKLNTATPATDVSGELEEDMSEDADSTGVETRQATLNTPAGDFTANITKDKSTNTVSGTMPVGGATLSATKDMTPGGAQTVSVNTNVAPNLNLSTTRKTADYNKGQLAGTKSVGAKYTDTTGALGNPGQEHTATRTAGVGFGGASGARVGKNYVDQYSVNEVKEDDLDAMRRIINHRR